MSNSILSRILAPSAKGDRVFCRFWTRSGCNELTEKELLRGSTDMATLLTRKGVKSGNVCFVIVDQGPELLFSFLGAMLIGAVPSIMPPLSSKQDPERYWASHEKLFTLYGTRFLISHKRNRPPINAHLATCHIEMIAVEEIESAPNPATYSHHPLAFLQHSSGTTSLKKGVALSHDSVLAQVRLYSESLGLSMDDHIVSWLPLYHDMGLIACLMLPLTCGTSVTYLDPFEWVVRPAQLFEAITVLRPTFCWQPNFAFAHLCRTVKPDPKYDLSSVRGWINCSEPCKARTFDDFAAKFQALGVRPETLQVCYAMAETVFAVSQTRLRQSVNRLHLDSAAWRAGKVVPTDEPVTAVRFLSAGPPLPEFRLKIVSQDREEQPPGTAGEIAISAPCLFSGYWNRPEETKRKLADGWYYTGDLGFIHDGELYVVGRKNDLLIVHGKNYYAHEIEDVANRTVGVHPGRAVAFGLFRDEIGSEDVVVVAESDLDTAQWPDLASRLRQSIMNEMGLQLLDAYIAPAGWLIKTTSGKISRDANSEKYRSTLGSL